jgi:hypothetical protein
MNEIDRLYFWQLRLTALLIGVSLLAIVYLLWKG